MSAPATAITARLASLTERLGKSEVSFIAYFLLSAASFFVLKMLLKTPLDEAVWLTPLFIALGFLAWPIKREDIGKPLQILLYSLLALCTFYLVVSKTHLTPEDFALLRTEEPMAGAILQYGTIVIVAFAALSIVRPGMALFVFLSFFYNKKATSEAFDLWISPTDWIIVFEVATLLVLFLIVAQGLARAQPLLGRYRATRALTWPLEHKDERKFQRYLLLSLVSVHMANYFFSGLAKTGWIVDLIDTPDPFAWALANETQNLVLVTWYLGKLPTMHWEGIPQLSYEIMSQIFVPLNFLVLFGQMACLLCFSRTLHLKLITLFYDAMHVIIFFATGIFFWKWIILNTTILIALHTLKTKTIPRTINGFLILLMLGSGFLFYIVNLAWFDTKSLNAAYMEAVDMNGESYRVPTNYFGSTSVTFAQGRIGRSFEGYFETGTFGNTYDYKEMRKANDCALTVDPALPALTEEEYNTLNRFLTRHHNYVVGRLEAGKAYHYNWYPHHIWSNVFAFEPFRTLDKRQIALYRYVVESVCLDYNGEGLETEIIKRETYDFPIASAQ